MNKDGKILYEAPTTSIVEVKTESGILATSDYHENGYYEE